MKRLTLLLLLLLAGAASAAPPQVKVDSAVAPVLATSTSSLSSDYAYTAGHNDRVLVAVVHYIAPLETGNSATLTAGGIPMVMGLRAPSSAETQVVGEFWYLGNPPAGGTVVATFQNQSIAAGLTLVCLYDADVFAPLGPVAFMTPDGTSETATLSPTCKGGMAIDACGIYNLASPAPSYTIGGGQTSRGTDSIADPGFRVALSSRSTGNNSVTMTGTIGASAYSSCYGAIEVRPAANHCEADPGWAVP